MNINRFHVIKDPVHGTMQFSVTENAWVKPFIDSVNFQRLRHIKQLGLGDFIFPGAVHTRFSHSLGCCYVSNKIAQSIGLTEADRQLVMLACLLHDIGHGPFSHTFEGMFYRQCIHHEDWTPYFLKDYETPDFFARYNQLNPLFPITEEKFHYIAQMIMHGPTVNPVLSDIVSSQLDADRFDYLLRDSHFCGVKYGEFDLSWMLHCMAIVQSAQGLRLGITYKGIGVVEHYLMARRLMLRNIYHTHKKLALEFYLIQLFIALAQDIDRYLPYKKIRESRLGVFLSAVNYFNQSVAQNDAIVEQMVELHEADGERTTQQRFDHKDFHAEHDQLMRQKQDFLAENYNHFKVLCDYDVFAVIKQLSDMSHHHPAIHLAQRLYNRQMPKIWRLDHVDLSFAKSLIHAFKVQYAKYFQPWQIAIIRTPHQAYSGESAPILVINDNGHVQSISEISAMIQAISDKLEHVAFLCIDQAIVSDPRIVGLVKQLLADARSV